MLKLKNGEIKSINLKKKQKLYFSFFIEIHKITLSNDILLL